MLGGGGAVCPRNDDDRSGGRDHGGGGGGDDRNGDDRDHDGWKDPLLRSQPVPHSLCAQHIFRRCSVQPLVGSDADADGESESESEGEAALRSLRHPSRAGQAVASERAYRPDTAHRSKSVSG